MNHTHPPTLESLCLAQGVEYQGDGTYLVPSSDGTKRYTVQEKPAPEPMDTDAHLWECNCLAGQHGRMCKHVRLVSGIVAECNEIWGDD